MCGYKDLGRLFVRSFSNDLSEALCLWRMQEGFRLVEEKQRTPPALQYKVGGHKASEPMVFSWQVITVFCEGGSSDFFEGSALSCIVWSDKNNYFL